MISKPFSSFSVCFCKADNTSQDVSIAWMVTTKVVSFSSFTHKHSKGSNGSNYEHYEITTKHIRHVRFSSSPSTLSRHILAVVFYFCMIISEKMALISHTSYVLFESVIFVSSLLKHALQFLEDGRPLLDEAFLHLNLPLHVHDLVL